MAGVGLDLDRMFEQSKAVGRPLLDTETPPSWFHAGQMSAWESAAMNVVCVAGSQGGKTAIQVYWLLRELQRCAPLIKQIGRGVGLYVGPTLKLLRKQAIPALRFLLEETLQLGKFYESPDMVFRFSEEGARRLLGFASDLVIQFAYAEDSSNLESVTGVCAVWDEVGQRENKLASYEALRRRLNPARSAGFGRILFGSTPYEWNFFKTLIHDPAEKGKDGYSLHRFPSWMNPLVERSVIEKEKDLMPIERWQMMYEGMFTQPAGQIYDCFTTEHNTCKRFLIPNSWPLVMGVDFGPDNTAAVLGARELDQYGEATGRVYIFGSYHGGAGREVEQNTAAGHIKKLRDMAMRAVEGFPKIPLGFAGSAQEVGWRGFWTLAGQPLNKPSDANVEYQIQTVWTAFKRTIEKGMHPGLGQLVIFDDLHSLLDDIHQYSRDTDEDGNRSEKIADKSKWHRLDALRYLGPDIFAFPVSKGSKVKIYRRNERGDQFDAELKQLEDSMFRRN